MCLMVMHRTGCFRETRFALLNQLVHKLACSNYVSVANTIIIIIIIVVVIIIITISIITVVVFTILLPYYCHHTLHSKASCESQLQ